MGAGAGEKPDSAPRPRADPLSSPLPFQATYGLGFLLACVYHTAQMDPDGLAAATVAGVPGPVWRTWDILWAQWLLGRAFGHAVGATHVVTIALTNVAFPAAVAGVAALAPPSAAGTLSLASCAQALVACMLASGAAKLGLEGPGMAPVPASRLRACGARVAVGLAIFPLPELWPSLYWLFHSAWHLLMAAGVHELYLALEGEPPARLRRTAARAARAAVSALRGAVVAAPASPDPTAITAVLSPASVKSRGQARLRARATRALAGAKRAPSPARSASPPPRGLTSAWIAAALRAAAPGGGVARPARSPSPLSAHYQSAGALVASLRGVAASVLAEDGGWRRRR
jgi:hypothetical protein